MNAWLEGRKSKSATRFDALSAAVTLEGYAITCADRISNHNLATSSAGHAGSYLAEVPDLPELPIVIGFLRPQRASVANKLMIFPQESRQADQAVAFWWDATGDIDQVREVAVAEAAKIGLKALIIAVELRKAFKLPERNLIFGKYNVRKTLQENLMNEANA